jgi:hypothetical protein
MKLNVQKMRVLESIQQNYFSDVTESKLERLSLILSESSTVVEHSPHHPNVKGSSLATAAGTG